MNTWHSKDVGDGFAALRLSQKLHDAFIALIESGQVPDELSVFARYDLRANVVTWYFSPRAEILAMGFGATPCEKPVPTKGFALTVGDARSWEIHFPDYLLNRSRE